MFFLLPRVTLVLLGVFGALVGLRMWRQRHGARLARRPRRKLLGRRRAQPASSTALVPAAILRGADHTWVVFTSRQCLSCGDIARRLRMCAPDAQITEVDVAREPRLAEALGVTRLPTVLLANRYGQVQTRLVGERAVSEALDARR